MLMVFYGQAEARVKDFNLDKLKAISMGHKHEHKFSKKTKNQAPNELDLISSYGFWFYKSFISSQDNPSCVFYPSCSEFAIQSFRENGLLMGYFSTFDRLSRCHRLSSKGQYYYNETKQLFYDPIP